MNTDLLGGAVGLVLTVGFWYGRGHWSPLSAMFPNAVLVALGVLSVALLIKAFVRPEFRPIFAEGNRTRIAVTVVALLAWAWIIPMLGFYLASLVVFTALTIYIASSSRRVTVKNVGIWVVIVAAELAALHVIFAQVLGVPLPAGIFAP
jgi:putative tricarboxylic transport membrane protein